MATLATPGMPISRGLIFHRASTDMSISDSCFELRPIIMTRLSEATGWIMIGALPTAGSAWACDSRSCTACRARSTSVPRSKTRSIEESPVMDSERMVSSHGTPLSRSCSRGTVMSCSTSAADSPSASVWICTVVGTNSGYTSTEASCSWTNARTGIATAAATTRRLSRRLELTIHRIIAADPTHRSRARPKDPAPRR